MRQSRFIRHCTKENEVKPKDCYIETTSMKFNLSKENNIYVFAFEYSEDNVLNSS